MPKLKGWLLPREGLSVDPFLRLIERTALNPAMLIPLAVLAQCTPLGRRLVPTTAASATTTRRLGGGLLVFALVRWISGLYSDVVRNNWARDKYDWPREVAVVTGGAGGIGGHIARILADRGVKVAVLDIQPMTFEVGQ